MKIIYKVRNKAFSALFEDKEHALRFLNQNATGSNGLTLSEVMLLQPCDEKESLEKKEE